MERSTWEGCGVKVQSTSRGIRVMMETSIMAGRKTDRIDAGRDTVESGQTEWRTGSLKYPSLWWLLLFQWPNIWGCLFYCKRRERLDTWRPWVPMRQALWRLGKRAKRETYFWVALGAQDRLETRNLQGITDTGIQTNWSPAVCPSIIFCIWKEIFRSRENSNDHVSANRHPGGQLGPDTGVALSGRKDVDAGQVSKTWAQCRRPTHSPLKVDFLWSPRARSWRCLLVYSRSK